MDYFADYAAECREQLDAAKLRFDSSTDSKVVECFLNCLIRQIPPKPRHIMKADTFRWPPEVRGALNSFTRKSQKGQSLKPFLSNRIQDAHYNDQLFNDWLIHHFHLGRELPNGEIERADYLLYAIVVGNAILCIDIISHSDKDSWYRKEMVDIAYRNWPEIFESTNLNTMLPSTTPMTDAEIKRYRKLNVGYSLTMADGTVNMGLGMGSMSNGFSMRAHMELMRVRRACTHLQEYTAANLPMFIRESEKLGSAMSEPFDFHIQFHNGTWGFYELTSRTFFNMEEGLGLNPHKLL